MINTLYLPELREMLAVGNADELREFCVALHPARTVEFMEGLTSDEAWRVLQHADLATRVAIFTYFDPDRQREIASTQDRDQVAELIGQLAADDRVDVLQQLDQELVHDLLSRLSAADRRDTLRLSQYPEGTAGAMMTTEFARLRESTTVRQALDELSRQAADFETIYYLYIVNDQDKLSGLVSARKLLTAIRRPETRLGELMDTDLITAGVLEDQEEVARKVAQLDLLAIPVVDQERHIVGIITHDDVIDVLHEEAVEDAQRIAGVAPLEESYLKESLATLSWKRGMWLAILFFGALATAVALNHYEAHLHQWEWLILFLPMIISSGGNSGNQSATLVITALARGQVKLSDWSQIVLREVIMGLTLGTLLGTFGFLIGISFGVIPTIHQALVIPLTLILVVLTGSVVGASLPLLFRRTGLDPALMSNPFIACISDALGILIYMNVAWLMLS